MRSWASQLLRIIEQVHDVSCVLRTLNPSQIYVARDGSSMKLAHFRGVGQVNCFGNLAVAPDVYLSLEGSRVRSAPRSVSSASANEVKSFALSSLATPYLAPEMLFQPFSEHTAAMDVWSFGMIMMCVLFGREPRSFYSEYREWLKDNYRVNLEDDVKARIPFVPPAQASFIYDPLSYDLQEYLYDTYGYGAGRMQKQYRFTNMIECLPSMSYSALFSKDSLIN